MLYLVPYLLIKATTTEWWLFHISSLAGIGQGFEKIVQEYHGVLWKKVACSLGYWKIVKLSERCMQISTKGLSGDYLTISNLAVLSLRCNENIKNTPAHWKLWVVKALWQGGGSKTTKTREFEEVVWLHWTMKHRRLSNKECWLTSHSFVFFCVSILMLNI